MSDILVHRQDTATGGRYSVSLPGIAETATLSWIQDGDIIIAEHTFSPASMRGKGAAMAMVQKLVQDARAQKHRIRPDCTYVRAQFDRHPEWAEQRAELG